MQKENKKKIIFFSHSPNLYGAPRCLLLLLEKLDQKKYNPFVICAGNGLLIDRVRALGIDIRVIPRPKDYPLRKIAYILKLYSFLRDQKPDLVYVNSVVHASPILAAKLLGIPLLLHVHESRKYFGWDRGLIMKFADRFICISKATEKLLLDRNVSSHKISIVYDGVNSAEFYPSKEKRQRYRTELGLDKDDILVGLIGQIIPRKGTDDFVKAAGIVNKKEKGCRFIIVGGVMDNRFFKSKVLPLCHKYNLKDRITFTGFKEDVTGYLSAIDIFVSASKAEPFGMVNIEAMAMGKPVVATNAGGHPEIIVDGKTGFLVPPGNAESLANAVLNLAGNNDLRSNFGKAGSERVQKYFTIDRYYQGIEKVFNQMLAINEKDS